MIVARDNESVRSDLVDRRVIAITRRIKIEEFSVLFSQPSVIIEAQAGADAEIGPDLKLVLHIGAIFFLAIVTVGIALVELRGHGSIRRIGDRGAREEAGEVGEADDPRIRSLIARVELGVGKASGERAGMLAIDPNGVDGRHPAVLKNSGESTLRSCRRSDTQPGIENEVWIVRGAVSQIIHNRDS